MYFNKRDNRGRTSFVEGILNNEIERLILTDMTENINPRHFDFKDISKIAE